jgi:hypothetical protein
MTSQRPCNQDSCKVEVERAGGRVVPRRGGPLHGFERPPPVALRREVPNIEGTWVAPQAGLRGNAEANSPPSPPQVKGGTLARPPGIIVLPTRRCQARATFQASPPCPASQCPCPPSSSQTRCLRLMPCPWHVAGLVGQGGRHMALAFGTAAPRIQAPPCQAGAGFAQMPRRRWRPWRPPEGPRPPREPPSEWQRAAHMPTEDVFVAGPGQRSSGVTKRAGR